MSAPLNNIFELLTGDKNYTKDEWNEHNDKFFADFNIESCDQHIEIDGAEYRIIHDSVIEQIHTDEVREIAEECFIGDLPNWVVVDWKETAENVRLSDGYGHHFSSYDGSEEFTDGYYIFRIA